MRIEQDPSLQRPPASSAVSEMDAAFVDGQKQLKPWKLFLVLHERDAPAEHRAVLPTIDVPHSRRFSSVARSPRPNQ